MSSCSDREIIRAIFSDWWEHRFTNVDRTIRLFYIAESDVKAIRKRKPAPGFLPAPRQEGRMTDSNDPKFSRAESAAAVTAPPEFSRRLVINRIGHDGMAETIKANKAECRKLARRLDIPGIHALNCRFRIIPEPGDHFVLEGVLTAHVTLECVITGETFEDALNESFAVRMVPARRFSEDSASDLEAIDEIPYEGNALDLGEVASEQLALMLPSYPRKPGAALENAVDEAPRETAEEAAEEEGGRPNPFGALAGLSLSKKKTDLS